MFFRWMVSSLGLFGFGRPRESEFDKMEKVVANLGPNTFFWTDKH